MIRKALIASFLIFGTMSVKIEQNQIQNEYNNNNEQLQQDWVTIKDDFADLFKHIEKTKTIQDIEQKVSKFAENEQVKRALNKGIKAARVIRERINEFGSDMNEKDIKLSKAQNMIDQLEKQILELQKDAKM